MDAHESLGIELCFHGSQRLSHHPRAFAGMEMQVFVVCLYPVNFSSIQEADSAISSDDDTIQVRFLGLDAFEKRPYLQTPFFVMLRMTALLHMFQRRLEAHLVERL